MFGAKSQGLQLPLSFIPSPSDAVNLEAPPRKLPNGFPSAAADPVPAAAPLPGLELVRGLACLQVFLSHILIVLMFHSQVPLNPAFWKLAVFDWSYQSVMVFFVLSGYVIALSQQHHHRNFLSFMRCRFRRLEPLYLVALLISFGVATLLYSPPAYDRLLGHLFFIQGSSLAPVFSTNTPLWSLGYEFFFYLIFALTIGSHQKRLQILWLLLGLGATALTLGGFSAPGLFRYFQSILALSPVWLLGAFLIQRPLWGGTNLVQNLMLLGMLPLASDALPFLGAFNSPAHSLMMGLLIAPLLSTLAQTKPIPARARPFGWILVFGLYFLLAGSFLISTPRLNHHTQTIFALLAPFGFLGAALGGRLVFGARPFFTPRITRFSLGLGKMSYAIYVIHWPILIALGAVMQNPFLQIILDILLVLPLAWLLEYRVQPVLASLFDRLWPARPPGLLVHAGKVKSTPLKTTPV